MGIEEKIKELEDELRRTQKNKATEYHIGILKAKIAKLRRELLFPKKSSGKKGGFDVKKSGDATVVFIGLPSVGKSTLLNKLTGAKSKTAEYAFTTLNCIPGTLDYQGAKIQLLDLPGIIIGAHEGKGRGREIISVARNADLILIVLDVFQPTVLPKIKEELHHMGIRLDKTPPDISLVKRTQGGIKINSTVKLNLDQKTIIGILNEYGIHNADIVFRQDCSEEDLVDFLEGNRKYIKSLVVLNKIDMVKEEYLNSLDFEYVPVSAEAEKNLELLKKKIFEKLDLIKVYTKPKLDKPDLNEPMLIKKGSSVEDVCKRIHKDLLEQFRYAVVWGKSAKFPGQKVGLNHILEDGDIISIVKKQ